MTKLTPISEVGSQQKQFSCAKQNSQVKSLERETWADD